MNPCVDAPDAQVVQLGFQLAEVRRATLHHVPAIY
jgi:hypothetical protein